MYLPGHLFAVSLLTSAILTAVAAPVPSHAGTRAPLFGTVEIRNTNLKPFPKWTGMLDRMFAEQGSTEGPCNSAAFNKCHREHWQALIDQQTGKPLLQQLQSVNSFMNDKRYIVDPINWGVNDYWATPKQFFSKYGDCEDYAIAKYVTLKRLGLATEDMRIVVLQDLNLGIAHAVLAVFVNGRVMILDNQIKQVVNAQTIRHYRPIFSINEEAWWLHRPGGSAARARTGKAG